MVYVFLADGFEEIEALTVVDVLRRAEIPVLTVGVSDETIFGAHNIEVNADVSPEEVELAMAKGIVLPGGMPGTVNLYNSEVVRNAVKYADENHLLLAAICAAPSILGKMDILKGKKAVCYPGFEKELEGAEIADEKTVVSDNIITSKGAGTALDFALEIVKYFAGEEKANDIGSSMQK